MAWCVIWAQVGISHETAVGSVHHCGVIKERYTIHFRSNVSYHNPGAVRVHDGLNTGWSRGHMAWRVIWAQVGISHEPAVGSVQGGAWKG